MTPSELGAYVFVQVALIIATCRLIGYAVRRWLGQPQVAGEMMELIIINIGLQRGIIGPALFSMLVIMAIVTTFMASPLFDLVYGSRHTAAPISDGPISDGPISDGPISDGPIPDGPVTNDPAPVP